MNFSQLLQSASLAAPELILSLAGLVLTVFAPLLKKISEQKRSLFFCAAALAGTGAAFYFNSARFHSAETAFSGFIVLDPFSGYFNSIFLVNIAATTLFARAHLREAERLGEFLALALFCTVGMMFMAESVEFVSLFIAFETMSISVYALSGFSRNIFSSAEAGIKYLITGGFASAVMLFGIALLYGATGSLMFEEIGASFSNLSSNPMLITGTVLVFAGFIFKIGAAPLHQWIPDVYEGAPLPAVAFMSVGVKVAAFAVLARFAVEIGAAGDWGFQSALIVIAVITMLVGNISAIVQNNIKRMLAYSSIAHAGYAIVGIIAYLSGENTEGLSGLFYYLYAYTIMSLGAFGVILLIGKEDNEYKTFGDISGLWRTKPVFAVALAVFMFSLAGIPVTIGFFAKLKVFLPAAKEGMYWLVVFALVNSVVSAYYYLKVLVFAFMRPVTKQQTEPGQADLGAQAVILILCAGVLLLGIFPLYSVEITDAAARVLTVR